MDKRYVERKLEVMKTVFEQNTRDGSRMLQDRHVMEIFGETAVFTGGERISTGGELE